MSPSSVNVFWFRRDLRVHDNAGLYYALREGKPVLPVFIFDTDILDELENKADARVEFIYNKVSELNKIFKTKKSGLYVFHGKPLKAFEQILSQFEVDTVYTNHDYEPYAIKRDSLVKQYLLKNNVQFKSYKDQVVFEKNEVVKPNGEAYSVFTPYSRKWKSTLNDFYLSSYPSEKKLNTLLSREMPDIPSLEQMGFQKTTIPLPAEDVSENLIRDYGKTRDFPGLDGTSRLGIHLRFGSISIRELVRNSSGLSEVYLNELIWREFYQCILFHHPRVAEGHSFKPAYDRIHWRTDNGEFQAWCEGRTGYPIVDAGMRELNQTGFMHNRVRMITASFLCKHLLLDWRLGEAYFAEKLLDYELASNNGGWQWAAGSGCDAAPYFRIFNPYLQTKKFDPGLHYIRKWVPEFESFEYPKPIVDHEFARKRCIEVYSEGLRKQ